MPRITEMFAFVAADKGPDDEGVMAMRLPNGEWAPMVGADMKRVESYRPIAEQIKKITGKPYKILRFKLVGEVTHPGAPASP
jgi:hypothetical protein